ncbi:MAG: hypothetical protein EB066_11230 [Betaproteobacteria bacterium]|jgi:hypothetical protein|nr:hypothetical protein [Betaproteobacteria bacterium]NDF06976.1 hypothetical protein [Betaproteobacteria bacterium]
MKSSALYLAAMADTPEVKDPWRTMDYADRKSAIIEVIQSKECQVCEVVSIKNDGQVIIRFTEPVAVSKRGLLLLDLEAALKSEIDQGITVWVEALGDKNSLRNLRGIEVKS